MTQSRHGVPLNSDALEALALLVRILRRCGFAEAEIQEAVAQSLASLPKGFPPLPPNVPRELPEAGHLLTLWHLEPAYVDQKGEPRKLPRRGKPPSFEALAQSINTNWDIDEVIQYLLKSRAVRRTGSLYVPTRRSLVLMGFDGPATFRNVRGIAAMLRTNEHNLTCKETSQGWFERNTENFNFPVGKLPEFSALLNREGMAVLERLDAYMRGCEATRAPNEPTMTLGVGVYRYQQDNT